MMLRAITRAGLALLTAGLLAACTPPGPPIEIRPGLGQNADLDRIRPPSGVTYRYMLDIEELPLPVELRMTSRKRAGNRYDYVGNYIYTLPSGEGLAEVSQVLRSALEVDDLKVEVRGNQLLVPYRHTADNRFRIAVSTYQSERRRTTPHDCYGTLGTCRYRSKISGDPIEVDFIAETTEANGVWTTRIRPDPKQSGAALRSARQTITYSMDRNAVPIDLIVQSSFQGLRDTVVFRRK